MSTLQTALKQIAQPRLVEAVNRAQSYLLSQQNLEGFWWAELEANVTLTAEYIMLHRILIHSDGCNSFSNGRDREAQIQQMARYLLRQQRSHGGWELFYGDGGEISTTVEAYFALKLAGHGGAVLCTGVSADGSMVASGGADGTVKVWDTAEGNLLTTFTGHVGPVRAVAFGPDGGVVYSGGEDGTLRRWPVAVNVA